MYSQKVADQICERIATGEPLAQICRGEGMPARRTVYLWMQEHADFAAHIARARQEGYDEIGEECLTIANTPHEGVEYVTKADGGIEERRGDMLGHRKLQIETRLKLLAKWDPKRYGEKVHLDHSGGIALTAQDMSDADLAKVIAAGAKQAEP